KDDLDTQLVIAGTGGKLTMLNEATGLGSGNADSHQSSFDDLAIEEASVISELFQRYFDAEVLERAHPGEPMLAYFKLKADDKQDLKAFSDTYGVAVRAGLVTPNLADEAQFREMTSLPPVSPEVKASWAKNPTREPITIQQIGQPQPGQFGRPSGASGDDTEPEPIEDEGDDSEGDEDETAMVNRAGKEMVRLVEAFSDDLAPIRQRLERILAIEDESILRAKLEEFRGELPQLLKDINADPRAARVMEDFMQAAFQQGVKS
ncbi:MAG: hypothetical protein RLZZ182_1396, partial [Pseudomonadota bacterium]